MKIKTSLLLGVATIFMLNTAQAESVYMSIATNITAHDQYKLESESEKEVKFKLNRRNSVAEAFTLEDGKSRPKRSTETDRKVPGKGKRGGHSYLTLVPAEEEGKVDVTVDEQQCMKKRVSGDRIEICFDIKYTVEGFFSEGNWEGLIAGEKFAISFDQEAQDAIETYTADFLETQGAEQTEIAAENHILVRLTGFSVSVNYDVTKADIKTLPLTGSKKKLNLKMEGKVDVDASMSFY